MPDLESPDTLRFGDFELDLAAYELRRLGRKVRLERQPMDLLLLLVERRPQLVVRSDIVERLWSQDVFVDVERGINTAIRKIRRALRDSPRKPRFVETVSGRGYRFTAVVDVAAATRADRFPVRMAVLPFEAIAAGSELDYVSDGLTDEIIATLGLIDPARLRIVGRTSVRSYKNTDKTVTVIGAELGVDYLLEGVLRGEHGQLRITTKLIRVRDQVQVWSAIYNRPATDILGLQRELSAAIAGHSQVRLSAERASALGRRQTINADAYDLYLRGRQLWNHLTAATTRRAVEYFTRATDLDPEYALAWAGIAEAYASSAINGDAPPNNVWPLARRACARALTAESGIAEVQHVTGQIEWFFEWDWSAAESAFRRAIALDGNFAWSHSMLGHVLSQGGRHDEAQPIMRRAREIEPRSALHHAMSSQVAFQAGDYAAALDFARQAIVLDPEFWVGYMMRGQACAQRGEFDEALEALAIATRLSNGNSKPISLRGYVLAKHGRIQEAHEVLRTLVELSGHDYVPPYAVALIHAGLNDADAAFDWLDRGFEARDVHLVFLPVDAKWDEYRRHHRLIALLERCQFTGDSTRSPKTTHGMRGNP